VPDSKPDRERGSRKAGLPSESGPSVVAKYPGELLYWQLGPVSSWQGPLTFIRCISQPLFACT